MPLVQVLLATFNGEKFLREQVQSVIGQTFQDFEILAADDGSTDQTPKIIAELAREYPGRIRVLAMESVGGAARNFMRLIEAANADYLMCCDQDDFWLPRKIELLVGRCQSLEACHPGEGVLVFSDLVVVDASLRVINESMFAYQRIDPTKTTLKDLLLQSCVTGCATIINRPLAKLVKGSDPDEMFMHDWWISLVASAFGLIDVLRVPTVLYRQHEANTFGAGRFDLKHVTKRIAQLARGGRLNRHLRRSFRQASSFSIRYAGALQSDEKLAVRQIAELHGLPPLTLRWRLLRHRLLRQGFIQNLVSLIAV